MAGGGGWERTGKPIPIFPSHQIHSQAMVTLMGCTLWSTTVHGGGGGGSGGTSFVLIFHLMIFDMV